MPVLYVTQHVIQGALQERSRRECTKKRGRRRGWEDSSPEISDVWFDCSLLKLAVFGCVT